MDLGDNSAISNRAKALASVARNPNDRWLEPEDDRVFAQIKLVCIDRSTSYLSVHKLRNAREHWPKERLLDTR